MVSDFYIPDLDYHNEAAQIDAATSPWIEGYVEGPYGGIPRLRTTLDQKDKLGAAKVRLGIGRDDYIVPPGLYAVGNPDKGSPVLVTANYKLTVDILRSSLAGVDAWVVAVDSKGINVWCAAGKGTFGTYEVIKKLKELKLKELVSHRTVILPQLAASGVAAYQVLRNSGFKAVFGPVRAADVREFLRSGLKATEEMRTVRFGAASRLLLTPVELVHNLKWMLIMLAAMIVYSLFTTGFSDVNTALATAWAGYLPLITAIITSCVLVPLLLPYIPFRAFAAKGLVVGLVLDVLVVTFRENISLLANSWLLLTAYCILIPAITTLLSLNFTGSTTYTSFSGVKKETEAALPLARIAIGLSIALAVISLVL